MARSELAGGLAGAFLAGAWKFRVLVRNGTWALGLSDRPPWLRTLARAALRAGFADGIRAVAVCTGELTAEAWHALALPGVEIHADLAAFVTTLA